MTDFQQISVTDVGDVAVVRFRSNKIIDEMQIQLFGDELFSLVNTHNRRAILLNFEDVEFLSSAALGKLIKLDKLAKASKAGLKLTGIRPEIYEVFSITKLDQMFEIKDSESDALAAF